MSSVVRYLQDLLVRAPWREISPETLHRVRALIAEYLAAVETSICMLREHFGVTELLAAVRQGRIERHGVVPGARYSFHGAGCEVALLPSRSPFRGPHGSSKEIVVDFDFGPQGECDLFDAWRLAAFAASVGGEYAAFAGDDRALERHLACLAHGHSIERAENGFYRRARQPSGA